MWITYFSKCSVRYIISYINNGIQSFGAQVRFSNTEWEGTFHSEVHVRSIHTSCYFSCRWNYCSVAVDMKLLLT
jgi:hypothetical protein